MEHILVVEDELGLVEFLRMELQLSGYEVSVSMTGTDAMDRVRTNTYECVLLDVMLPDVSGFDICQQIRQVSDVPIIMLTARGAVADRVMGLDVGADDYLVKPFAIEELHARIRAVWRRQQSQGEQKSEPMLRIGDICVQLEKHRVLWKDEPVELTMREYELLVHFMRNPNHVFSRDELLMEVWGFESPVDTNVVDVYMGYLRQKLDPRKVHLQTVRGLGYVFREGQS